ncbi:MAG TPA: hypothetical protein VFG20_02320 [Planctomycetaceae bacterium]|nr:hypothetical protein [Planctomycetaceae bacterium]
MRGRFLLGILCGLAMITMPASARALDLVEVRWGYDGKLTRNRFNVLSILVNHPLPTAFEGEMRLTKRMASGGRVDAPVVESVFVSPFGERWVQFYPYISSLGNSAEDFHLDVISKDGRLVQSLDLQPARFGWPSRIMIEPAGVARKNVPLKRLPDILFPPFVTATDGLQAVFFDSVPNWDEPRRQAFLDWLQLGGTAFVMHDATGKHPEFPATMGVLNGPLDERMVGAGRVFRVAYARTEATPERLTDTLEVLPPRRIVRSDGQTYEEPALDAGEQEQVVNTNFGDGSDPLSGSSFLTRLKNMTKPDHNWPVLHLLFWIYIALIFPGCYLVGRKWADYRLVYLMLLGTVALFSLLFGYVGQRGYGEATAVHSVAIARVLPDGQADVTQWSNVFVTSGGDYDIAHEGLGTLYSTCNIAEAVPRWIRNGAEALFRADIPPFSSREFSHRIKTRVTVPKFAVTSSQFVGGNLRAITLSVDGTVPPQAEMITLIHGDRFHNLTRSGEGLQSLGSIGTAAGYLRVQDFQHNWQFGMMGYGQSNRPAIDVYREMILPLMARRLGVHTDGDAQTFRLPTDFVRVMYFAPMTDELFVQNSHVGKQEGWVLYSVDVPLKEAP